MSPVHAAVSQILYQLPVSECQYFLFSLSRTTYFQIGAWFVTLSLSSLCLNIIFLLQLPLPLKFKMSTDFLSTLHSPFILIFTQLSSSNKLPMHYICLLFVFFFNLFPCIHSDVNSMDEDHRACSQPYSQCLLLLLLSRFSRVRLYATPQTSAHQALPSLGFSRQEHRSGLPFPSPMHESEK